MNSPDDYLALNTGAKMPLIGLGTWKSAKSEAGKAVEYALTEAGYKHVDCAPIYGNEKEIGEAFTTVFQASSLRREEVFVTSKLWDTEHSREDVRIACEATLRDLRLDYLDLYLMHWGIAEPKGGHTYDVNGHLVVEKVSIRETWEAMEGLVDAGLVKAIGVANFTAPLLLDLLSYARVQPAVNQIELHPYLQQVRLVDFCRRLGMAVTAYSPLARPGYEEMSARLVDEKVIREIASAHGKTPSQVLLRWGIQRNTVVIPKSTHPERIQENISVFDFELSESDMREIAGLERGLRIVDPYQWGQIPYFD
ncbi:MAG: aldo/keto reductase [bacterium]|nr:aldo/keto reductase [bacterium]